MMETARPPRWAHTIPGLVEKEKGVRSSSIQHCPKAARPRDTRVVAREVAHPR
jgi:hypothetical protein